MNRVLDAIRNRVRSVMRTLAKGLNTATEGKLSPNTVTLFGLFMHLPIAILIASGDFVSSAILLVIFGLFDTLDGELARLQKHESKSGMFLDSVTDRIKEVIVYVGVGYYFVFTHQPNFAIWVIAALGAALVVSYSNAWGEVATSGVKPKQHQTNSTFRSGVMTFDVRMFVLVVGLAANRLEIAVIVIALGSCLTALQRIISINKSLK